MLSTSTKPLIRTRSTPHAASGACTRQDDFFVGEDAIGTKLDLAKAYLDMGDPEGAKSMLDEVLAEGNDVAEGRGAQAAGGDTMTSG